MFPRRARDVSLPVASGPSPCPSPSQAAAVTGSRQIVFSSARRAPRRRWTRVVGVLFAVLLVVLLVAVLAGGGLWLYASARLGGDRIAGLDEPTTALGAGSASTPAELTTVLVALTASHDPADPRAPELRGPVLLVQVGGPREVPAVLALPSDLPVTLDGAPSATIAEVQAQGDVDALARALADYVGVRIDHVVRASEDVLPRLVELHRPERCDGDRCRELTPEEVRQAQAEGDATARVRAVATTLRSLAGQLDTVGSLTSPIATKRTVDVVARDVRTDVALRGAGLLDLARAIEGSAAPDVATVPMLRNPETGRLVLLEQAETLFQRFREGDPLVAGDGDDLAEASPSELVGTVRVAVLNGAGVDGLAGQVEGQLAADGYLVVGTGNAPAFGDSETIVTYDPEDPAAEIAAILLAERLGDVSLQASDRVPMFEGEPVGVIVTAGADLADG
jgi:hypothetical protein